MSKIFLLLLVLVCVFPVAAQEITQGSLYAFDKKGKELGDCPLKNTAVKTEISGFIARVHVTQVFENSFTAPIEAVYTFPLSQNGAVDDMTMTVGSRVIHGKIMRREEARQTYEQAKAAGKTASLLDQERPNIFTQSVANIMPGDRIQIEISYVETLKYEDGSYEFVFPMTVGPRYISASGVQDAAKVRPAYATARNGSDISVEVNLNAGVPVEEIRSPSHEIQQVNFTPATSKITLKNETTIPNKDFILCYDVSGGKIEDAVLTHRDERGGFFTLILQPPDRFTSEDRTPKEIVFVLDTSGSMWGFPIDKAKEAMKMSLDGLYPDDTFNLITFSGDTAILFDGPVPATEANIEKAKAFIDSRQGSGGTEMMKAIKAALDPSDSKDHLRIVCFMTDGFVGNDDEIIADIKRHPQARVFSFGIGSSVNRYLLDKMAEAGHGEVQYVTLTEDGSLAAKKFYERVRTPLLTDLSIDWNGLPVTDMYPSVLTDLFSAKPVIVHGRFTKPTSGTIKLRGLVAGQPYEREIAVSLPDNEPANDALASLWARTRIDELSSDKLSANDAPKSAALEKQITDLALDYRLMTNFTSFVAVEDRVVNQNGKPITVQVPVEVPEGVDPTMSGATSTDLKGAYKKWSQADLAYITSSQQAVTISGGVINSPATGGGTGTGYGSGSGSASLKGRPAIVGAVTETVEVTASEPDVNQSIATAMTTISADMLSSLPTETTVSGRSTGSVSSTYRNRAVKRPDMLIGSENAFTIETKDLVGPTGKHLSNEPVSGRGVAIVEPELSADLKKVQGNVDVQIAIDRDGNVTSATAVSGPDELRKSCEKAAMLSKFAPVNVDGNAIRVSGIATYHFKSSAKPQVFLKKMTAEPLTASDLKLMALSEKLHFWLYALADRLERQDPKPTPNEALFVRDGKANIRLDLTSADAAVIEKLKSAGLEIVSQKGNRLTGRISVEKVASLADIAEVKLILPLIL